MKDFPLAKKDFEEALVLCPKEEEARKMRDKTQEDIEYEERVREIMSKSEGLDDKTYVDFLLSHLQGEAANEQEGKEEQKEKSKEE